MIAQHIFLCTAIFSPIKNLVSIFVILSTPFVLGKPNLCKTGGLATYMGLSPVNGALTEYVVISEDLLFKLPDDLSFEKAVLCETMSTVIRGCDQMQPLDDVSLCRGKILCFCSDFALSYFLN